MPSSLQQCLQLACGRGARGLGLGLGLCLHTPRHISHLACRCTHGPAQCHPASHAHHPRLSPTRCPPALPWMSPTMMMRLLAVSAAGSTACTSRGSGLPHGVRPGCAFCRACCSISRSRDASSAPPPATTRPAPRRSTSAAMLAAQGGSESYLCCCLAGGSWSGGGAAAPALAGGLAGSARAGGSALQLRSLEALLGYSWKWNAATPSVRSGRVPFAAARLPTADRGSSRQCMLY